MKICVTILTVVLHATVCFCLFLFVCLFFDWDVITDTKGRSQISYTALCNSVVSHGAPIEGIQVLPYHSHRNKCKPNVSMIFMHMSVLVSRTM